jgi:hypothetical protein
MASTINTSHNESLFWTVDDCNVMCTGDIQMVDGDTRTADGCTLMSTDGNLMVSGDTRTVDSDTLTVGSGSLMGHGQHQLGSGIASRTQQHHHQHDSIVTSHHS